MKTHLLVLFAALFATSSALADNPCKAKAEAKHEARKALNECIKGLRTNTDDDCGANLSNYIALSKNFKTCRVDQEKTLAGKPCYDKAEANRVAHNALHQCLDRWVEDISVFEADPTDNCSTQLAAVGKTEQSLATCMKPPARKTKK
jgi:hypothetical protein